MPLWWKSQAVGNLLRVRTLVLQHIAKQDEEKTTDFLCDSNPLPALCFAASSFIAMTACLTCAKRRNRWHNSA